jgi:hypothetical protein
MEYKGYLSFFMLYYYYFTKNKKRFLYVTKPSNYIYALVTPVFFFLIQITIGIYFSSDILIAFSLLHLLLYIPTISIMYHILNEYHNHILKMEYKRMEEELRRILRESMKAKQGGQNQQQRSSTIHPLTRYYQILGLGINANSDEVKKAYRKLAKLNHPDVGGDPKKFILIKEAYEKINSR